MKNIILMSLFIIPIANYAQIPQRLREAQELQIYEENSLKGVKDRNGNIILTPQYYAIEYAGDGRWEIEDTSHLSGFIDKYGKIIVPPKYRYVPYDKYNEGFCFVNNNEGGTYIDRQGNPLTAFIYIQGGFFSEGLGAVRGKNGKWGFIDSYGVEVIPCIYDIDRTSFDAPFFSEGLACVSKRGKTMYIDKQGKIFLKLPKDHYPVQPWHASNYNNGKALILDENLRLAFIDKQGNVTPKDKYKGGNFLEVFNNGFCVYWDYGDIVLNMDLDPVAEMHIRGDKWIKQADKWIEKKDTTLQHSSDDAVFHLANYYLEIHHDGFHDDAFWLLNNIPNNSKAQCSLGDMYYYGIGVEKNEAKAIEWYKKSNEPEAKKQLAILEGKEKIQEPIKKEEPVLLADTKTQNNNSEIATPQTPVESKRAIAKTSQDKIAAQNMSQAQEQSKQPATAERKEKRIALLIGNAKYNPDHGLKPLNCPENDVDDLKSALKKLGFTPVVRTNLNQLEMRDEIHNFCDTIKKYDVALFYYSGHAIQDREGIKILPVDEEFSKPGDKTNSVEFNYVLDELIESEVKTKILILDACRSRAIYKGIDARWTTPSNHGCFVAFATRAGEDAVDGDKIHGRNSVYTKALLESLNLEGDLDYIFNDVENKVYMRTKNSDTEQLPEHKNELRPRNFYLHK